MSERVTSLDPAPSAEIVPPGLVEAGTYASADAGFEHGLVVLATGNGYWLIPDERGHHLLVEPREADHIQRQLAKYDRESVGWPPAPVVHPARAIDWLTPGLWLLIMLAGFWVEAVFPSVVGTLQLDHDGLLLRGEWWRPITALLLHADVGHLISNTISGAFVVGAVTTTVGRRRGWLLITLSAVAGNVLSALSHSGEYRSLGASTAIFAALGLLTGHAVTVARHSAVGQRWRAITLPLISGCVVLALYGAGAANVDIGAHVFGFACGVALGLTIVTAAPRERDDASSRSIEDAIE